MGPPGVAGGGGLIGDGPVAWTARVVTGAGRVSITRPTL